MISSSHASSLVLPATSKDGCTAQAWAANDRNDDAYKRGFALHGVALFFGATQVVVAAAVLAALGLASGVLVDAVSG